MIANALTEPASASDASTLAGALVVLGLLAVAMLWGWLGERRNPDFVTITDHRQLLDALARSVASHPAGRRLRFQDVTCRFCGVPADPRVTGEWGLCMAVECWDKAAADQVTIDQAGYGS